MKRNWPEPAMSWIAELEGGETHETEGDPGGRTSGVGITQKTYDRYRRGLDINPQPVDYMTGTEEQHILKTGYWDQCECDELDDQLDFVAFQYAVNLGPRKAVKALQRACEVKVDGYLGPISKRALACEDTGLMVERVLDYQLNDYSKIGNPKFMKGWKNRVYRTASLIEFDYCEP